MIYFSSDLHWGHDKEFVYAKRGFNTIEEMNVQLLKNINDTVNYDDTLYLLGDVILGDISNIRYVDMINCQDIHIILGNHDTDTRIELYRNCYNVKSISYADRFKYKGYHCFLSHFPCLTGNFDDKDRLKGTTLNLCGHTHQENPLTIDRPWMYNVGVDANNLKPVAIDTIIEVLANNWRKLKDAQNS